MKRRKALSLLLSLAIVLSLVVPVTTAFAADDDTNNEGETKTSGLSINKTAVYDAENDAYTITLEAYATGEKTTTTVTEETPTDIILVLDQSGSMAWSMGDYEYRAYTKGRGYNKRNYYNSEYYDVRHNGGTENLWYKLSDNATEYVAVSVEQEPKYDPISNRNNRWYYDNQSNLRCLISGEYKTVTVKRTGHIVAADEYTYTVDGQQILYTTGDNNTPNFGDITLYQITKNYIYSYTVNDFKTIIEESQGDQISPNTQFYQRGFNSQAGVARLTALKNAVTDFANTVAKKAAGPDGVLGNDDDVNHRIAVVGYASNGETYNDYQFENTEVFVGATQHNYSVDAKQYYGSAFQNMNTPDGQANIQASIGALDANGATYTDYGMEMANGILDAYPLNNNEKRNRVIILFTDGFPGSSQNDFDSKAANTAINHAKTAKDNGTTVYTVGIFSGADATSAGNSSGNTTQRANWFMQQVSSNNGTPQANSYYLSADNHETLLNIFEQISGNIEDGGSSTTLTDSAVIRDIVAQAFTMPENTQSVNVYTAESDGSVNSWKERVAFTAKDGTNGVTINDRTVSVTGFSYKDNWCGNETVNGQPSFHNGKKLIIEFTVKAKDGFLGGNDVYTNDEAGIYENADSKDPLMEFNKPTVNVPVKDVTVTATDKNVYLLGKVTLNQLKNDATVTVGGIPLDLSKANDPNEPYGLEKWQTEYVTITVAVKDKAENVVTDKIESLTDDTTYTIEVTVDPGTGTTTPEKGPAATEAKGFASGNIYVFKPELTYKDSTAYYGEAVPANNDYSGNQVGSDVWKHEGAEAVPSQMIGEKPTLAIEYTPDSTKIVDNKYTKQDVPVKATVKIGSEDVTVQTNFVHQACESDCNWATPAEKGDPAFLIHVKTCTLTITKAGNVANEPFVFTVSKDGAKYTEVTIVGEGSVTIAELPVGIYSITEDTGWSWRYKDPTYPDGKEATLSAASHEGTIRCVNTKGNDQWLNDYDVISNIYGKPNTPATDGNN